MSGPRRCWQEKSHGAEPGSASDDQVARVHDPMVGEVAALALLRVVSRGPTVKAPRWEAANGGDMVPAQTIETEVDQRRRDRPRARMVDVAMPAAAVLEDGEPLHIDTHTGAGNMVVVRMGDLRHGTGLLPRTRVLAAVAVAVFQRVIKLLPRPGPLHRLPSGQLAMRDVPKRLHRSTNIHHEACHHIAQTCPVPSAMRHREHLAVVVLRHQGGIRRLVGVLIRVGERQHLPIGAARWLAFTGEVGS